MGHPGVTPGARGLVLEPLGNEVEIIPPVPMTLYSEFIPDFIILESGINVIATSLQRVVFLLMKKKREICATFRKNDYLCRRTK